MFTNCNGIYYPSLIPHISHWYPIIVHQLSYRLCGPTFFFPYPLVNVYITMENHLVFFNMGKLTISMTMFNSYVKLPEGMFLYFPMVYQMVYLLKMVIFYSSPELSIRRSPGAYNTCVPSAAQRGNWSPVGVWWTPGPLWRQWRLQSLRLEFFWGWWKLVSKNLGKL